jgi:hydroxyacylglutathione hydrolase
MDASLRDVIWPMDDDVIVLPGHGSQTTIGRERATNPFLQAAAGGAGYEPPARGW